MKVSHRKDATIGFPPIFDYTCDKINRLGVQADVIA